MTDWSTAAGSWLTSALALLAVAVSYGKTRQEVIDLRAKVKAMDQRLDALADVGHAVDLLRETSVSSNERVIEQRTADKELMAERFEGLRGELRSFMAGQASVRPTPPTAQRRKPN